MADASKFSRLRGVAGDKVEGTSIPCSRPGAPRNLAAAATITAKSTGQKMTEWGDGARVPYKVTPCILKRGKIPSKASSCAAVLRNTKRSKVGHRFGVDSGPGHWILIIQPLPPSQPSIYAAVSRLYFNRITLRARPVGTGAMCHLCLQRFDFGIGPLFFRLVLDTSTLSVPRGIR